MAIIVAQAADILNHIAGKRENKYMSYMGEKIHYHLYMKMKMKMKMKTKMKTKNRQFNNVKRTCYVNLTIAVIFDIFASRV